jgi:hypothetical protein
MPELFCIKENGPAHLMVAKGRLSQDPGVLNWNSAAVLDRAAGLLIGVEARLKWCPLHYIFPAITLAGLPLSGDWSALG